MEEQSKAETRDHNGDNDRYGNNVDYKKEDECSKNSTRGEGSMKVCKKKEFISVNFPSGNDGNLETESFDREKVKELKMSIVERLSSSVGLYYALSVINFIKSFRNLLSVRSLINND